MGIEEKDVSIEEKRELSAESWIARESIAEAMIPLIGNLYREKHVVTSVYSRPIVNRSVISIIKAHRFARQVDQNEISVTDTYPILQALNDLELGPSRIDVGKMAHKYLQYQNSTSDPMDVEAFVQQEVAGALRGNLPAFKPRDVVLYGFGRIGRLVARILLEKAGGGDALRLRAIVVRRGSAENDMVKRASLLRRDSVHGSFQGAITLDEKEEAIIANGNYIKVIYANDPKTIDYTQYGINDAIVVDNTGVWRDESGLGQHLECKGVSKVILTAPGKGDIKNIVFGVNHKMVEDEDKIVSAASCTTNAIVPVLKALNDKWGVENGHVETVHAYTNDQNLIDNYHKGNRRGRSAALNMVITETGAAKAVAKALPELAGKLTGNAIRVPTPNVSMAILNLSLDHAVSRDDLNAYLRHMSLHSNLQKQIDYIDSPEVVSTDFVGSRHASVVDAESTIVNDHRAVVYIWYDNEFGYSCQVVRLLQQMANIVYPKFPEA